MRGGPVAAGIGGGVAWLLLFGLLGRDLRGYAWWTVVAGLIAWVVSLALARVGDRGAAVGVAIATSLGWGFAATAVAVRWASSGDWPLW